MMMKPQQPVSNNWVIFIQWLAVITMVIDHLTRFVLPDYIFLANTVGRLSFPFFAAMIAWHCLFNTRSLFNYSQRLFIIGFISFVPYCFLIGFRFNILFTLAFSLVFVYLFNCNLYKVKNIILFVLSFYVLFNYSQFFEYGFFGLLLIPAFYLLFASYSSPVFLFITIPICCYVVASINSLSISIFYSLIAFIIVLYVTSFNVIRFNCFRIPRFIWLSFYPVHLSVLYFVL